jgi:hypothetical protein
MKHTISLKSTKTGIRLFLLLAVLSFSFASGNTQNASASVEPGTGGACDETLTRSENQFLNTLSKDGQPANATSSRSAALEYIRAAQNRYDQLSAKASQLTDPPIVIDEGGIARSQDLSAEFVLGDAKWGPSTLGTAGGTVTYSFMGNGLSLSSEEVSTYGKSVAISSLPGYQPCFTTDIENAFTAWQAVANIKFVQVSDSNTAFDAENAAGDIRIGAHYFDGKSNVLAHAYYPYPGLTGNGDLHFDKDENWTCDASGTDIGIVALHEIGHALGLQHENTNTVAVMDPYYNSNVTALRSDDINGAVALYGAAIGPSNDDFSAATLVTTPLPYTSEISTSSASVANDDPMVIPECDGSFLNKGNATVWYKYLQTSGITKEVSFDTFNSGYDTYLAVWTGTRGSLSLVGCDDDTYAGFQSQLSIAAASGVTYYIEVAAYNGTRAASAASSNSKSDVQPQVGGGFLAFHVNDNADLDVYVGGSLTQSYSMAILTSTRDTYAGVNNGPVRVVSTNGLPAIASERVAYTPDGGSTWTSFDEMMGMPTDQLIDTYVFPWYNNVEMNTQLRFGNVGNSATTVTVTVGGVFQGSYFLYPNQSTRVSYPNLNNGPVIVQSSGGVPIIASIRFAYIQSTSPLVVPGFSEMMGLPANQLTSSYLFPWYNNVEMNTQLRFGNVGGSLTTVKVTVGGVVQGSYQVYPNQSIRVSYTGLNSGPVKVESTGGIPIIASMRFVYIQSQSPLVVPYFSEMMGLPQQSLSTNHWFPIYDNVNHNMQLRFGNLGNSNANITVTIGGVVQGTYTIAPNQAFRVSYAGLNTGPVQVQSTNGVPIIASMRFVWIQSMSPLVVTSFSEMLGLPDAQLVDTYLFPWYNDVELDTQIRLAVP